MAEKMAEKKAPTPAEQEQVFNAAEIAANAPRLFGHSIDIATAALDVKHVESCTLSVAAKIIKEFAERKV